MSIAHKYFDRIIHDANKHVEKKLQAYSRIINMESTEPEKSITTINSAQQLWHNLPIKEKNERKDRFFQLELVKSDMHKLLFQHDQQLQSLRICLINKKHLSQQ